MGDHKGEEMKGRLKEAVGDLTGDKSLQREPGLLSATVGADSSAAPTVNANANAASDAASLLMDQSLQSVFPRKKHRVCRSRLCERTHSGLFDPLKSPSDLS